MNQERHLVIRKQQPKRRGATSPRVMLGVKVPPSLIEELDRRADQQRCTRSYLVAELLMDAMGMAWRDSLPTGNPAQPKTTAEASDAA